MPSHLLSLKDELRSLVRTKARIVAEQEMTLASGRKSRFYVDGKQVTLDARGCYLFAKCILEMIPLKDVDAVGGPTIGADPIASCVSLLSALEYKKPIRAFIVRKDSKAHGLQKKIEGPKLEKGMKVIVVEDVITTGGSVLKAIQAIEEVGAKVVQVISLVDRGEGGKEILAKYNYTPVFTREDIEN